MRLVGQASGCIAGNVAPDMPGSAYNRDTLERTLGEIPQHTPQTMVICVTKVVRCSMQQHGTISVRLYTTFASMAALLIALADCNIHGYIHHVISLSMIFLQQLHRPAIYNVTALVPYLPLTKSGKSDCTQTMQHPVHLISGVPYGVWEVTLARLDVRISGCDWSDNQHWQAKIDRNRKLSRLRAPCSVCLLLT